MGSGHGRRGDGQLVVRASEVSVPGRRIALDNQRSQSGVHVRRSAAYPKRGP